MSDRLDKYVITEAIRAEAIRRLASHHRPYTDEDRWRVESKIAREWNAQPKKKPF